MSVQVMTRGENASGQTHVPFGLTYVIAIASGDPRFVAPPEWRHPVFSNQTLTVSVPTLRGRAYVLEGKDSLRDAGWIMSPPPPLLGDGTVKTLSAPTNSAHQHFFRVRRQLRFRMKYGLMPRTESAGLAA